MARPTRLMSFTLSRMTLLVEVNRTTSSLSPTMTTPSTSPVLGVTRMLMMPLPPRDWSRYWSTGVRLPKPCSATVSSSPRSWAVTTPPTTTSPERRLMPLTPEAVRPMDRMSAQLKRMAWPLRVARITSALVSTTRTMISSSPSRRFRARMPVDRQLRNRESCERLAMPLRVTKRK